MIVRIGELGVRITIGPALSAIAPDAIEKGVRNRLGRFAVETGPAHFDLTIQSVPNIPWRAIIDPEDFTRMRGIVCSLEERFPFTGIPFEDTEAAGSDRGGASPRGRIVLAPPPRLSRGDLSMIPQTQFLLLVDHATGRGRALIKGQDFEDCMISFMKALQGAMSLVAPDHGALMLHGGSLAIDGRGYLFVGGSGAGKSTVAAAVDRDLVLSDDGSWCSRGGGGFSVFPTPFSQIDQAPAQADAAILKHVLFLRKAGRDYLQDISPGRAMTMLLLNHIHFFRFMCREAATRAFALVGELCRIHPVSTLFFARGFDPKSFFREIADESKKAV